MPLSGYRNRVSGLGSNVRSGARFFLAFLLLSTRSIPFERFMKTTPEVVRVLQSQALMFKGLFIPLFLLFLIYFCNIFSGFVPRFVNNI